MLPLELAVFHAINADTATRPPVVAAALWVSQQMPWVIAGVLLALALAGSGRQRRALAQALLAMALAWVNVQWLRHGVHVPRPGELGIGTQWIEHAARSGFPSMHTAVAFALAGGIALGRRHRRLAWLTWVAAFAMGWSRICLGVHFPSDVLAGALTGMLSAWCVRRVAAHSPMSIQKS